MYNVIVIGAGLAGLSAAMFLSDKELKTLVLDEDRSALKSAKVGNYLGFREPLPGADLLEIGRKQVQEDRGVPILKESVTEIHYNENHIEVKTAEGTYKAEKLILAVGQAAGMKTAELAGVLLVENDEPFTKMKIKIDDRCRTSVPNVYATGISVGVSSQAIIVAGHGAQTALNLISDILETRVHVHQSMNK